MGALVGVPITAKTPPNAYRNSSRGEFICLCDRSLHKRSPTFLA
ncbi:hypothetical protein [Nostoc flagelliforme]|nr:hypothetical protein [Nostoc flagelliforme]